MNNFLDDIHPKYLCAKPTDGYLTHRYFRKVHFFTTPIILDALYTPIGFGGWVGDPFRFSYMRNYKQRNSCSRRRNIACV